MTNKEHIENLKQNFLEEMCTKLTEKDVLEIVLDKPLFYNKNDEGLDSTIYAINIRLKKFQVDDFYFGYWASFDDLTLEQIAYLLDEIDNEKFAVVEEW
jgi:hypothetical protein